MFFRSPKGCTASIELVAVGDAMRPNPLLDSPLGERVSRPIEFNVPK